jgi:hypothetical protein
LNILANGRQYLGPVPGVISLDRAFIRKHGEQRSSLLSSSLLLRGAGSTRRPSLPLLPPPLV